MNRLPAPKKPYVKPVAHLSEANLEMAKAALWYDRRVPGLGDRWLRALEAAQSKIQHQPQLGAPHRRQTRTWRVPKFPYRIVYREEPDRILILAFAHDKRRESY
jgi:plasmid stabilization system protein ParE